MKRVVPLAILWVIATLYTSPVLAFGSYASPYQIVLEGNDGILEYDYAVTGDEHDGISDGVVSCGVRQCLVGFFSRTGLGPAPAPYDPLCDSGGTCALSSQQPRDFKWVQVNNSSTWGDAYMKWINKYGRTGSIRLASKDYHPDARMYPGIAWGTLCIGFVAVPDGTMGVSQLAPGAGCSVVTPPDTSCFFAIQNTIDFGVVNTGDTPKPVTVLGGYSCGAVTSVSAAIGTSPSLGGAPLRLYMNGVLLSNKATRVARDKTGTLTLRAEFASPLVTVGSHQASVPVLMAFY